LYNANGRSLRVQNAIRDGKKGVLVPRGNNLWVAKKNPCNYENVTVVFLIASTKVDEAVEGAVDSWLQPSLI
jgi:hypothetical protein